MLRILRAAACRTIAKSLDALLTRNRAAVDDPGLQEVDQRLDFPALQQRTRRQRWQILAERGLGHATIATLLGIGLVVETRHRLARQATADDLDELVASKLGLAQVCGAATRLRRAGAVAGPTVAKHTLRLVLKDTAAEGEIVGAGRATGQHHQQQRRDAHTIAPPCPASAGVDRFHAHRIIFAFPSRVQPTMNVLYYCRKDHWRWVQV
jgi:hypothetical protein